MSENSVKGFYQYERASENKSLHLGFYMALLCLQMFSVLLLHIEMHIKAQTVTSNIFLLYNVHDNTAIGNVQGLTHFPISQLVPADFHHASQSYQTSRSHT